MPKVLAACLGIPLSRAEQRAAPLAEAMQMAQINTPLRAAHYLAQIGHETGLLRYREEIWGPTAAQALYERDFAAPWPTSLADFLRNRLTVYRRNRVAYSLGNVRAGDGMRYMGRGDIQCTGRTNYRVLTQRLRKVLGSDVPDFELAPKLLAAPEWASISGADYWLKRDLNALADADNLLKITERINGGHNGLAHRQALKARILTALSHA